jgi:hypothetical protein
MAQTRKCTNRDVDAGGNCRCGCGFNSDDYDDMCTGAFGEMCFCWECGETDRWSAENRLGLRESFDNPTIPAATIDRVARAIATTRYDAMRMDGDEWNERDYKVQIIVWQAMARAAIEAVRGTE